MNHKVDVQIYNTPESQDLSKAQGAKQLGMNDLLALNNSNDVPKKHYFKL